MKKIEGMREYRTHASARRNSAVKAKCSLPSVEYKTPPYNSLSRTVPIAERLVVLCSRKFMALWLFQITLITYLERKVFEGIRNTLLGLEPSASFYQNCDRRCGLVVVNSSNFDPSRINDGGKGASYALDLARRRSNC